MLRQGGMHMLEWIVDLDTPGQSFALCLASADAGRPYVACPA
jgi:hypothetical protein